MSSDARLGGDFRDFCRAETGLGGGVVSSRPEEEMERTTVSIDI